MKEIFELYFSKHGIDDTRKGLFIFFFQLINEFKFFGSCFVFNEDLNKSISTITYNYMNLPEQVTITNEGTITYQYNAAGVKLRKTVVDNTVSLSVTTVSDYDGIFMYKQGTLQYISHEEGRSI